MQSKERTFRQKVQIPVLWEQESRKIPTAITMVNGMQKMANRKGLGIKLYDCCDDLLRDESARRTVIVVGAESSRTPDILQTLQRSQRRIVVTNIDADHIDAHYSCATFSRRIATEQMLDYLLEKGCRHIALVGLGKRSFNDMVHRDAMTQYLLKYPHADGMCFEYQNRIDESFETFDSVKKGFDAVLCPNAFVAVAFLNFCELRNISVPTDLLVASMKDNNICRYCKPSLTSLAIDFLAIGEQSVIVWQYLQEKGNERFRMRIAVLGHVIERESTGTPLSQEALISAETGFLDREYEGGPFYGDPKLQSLMTLERCLQGCDELDFRIIGLLLDGVHYDIISEKLYLGESSLQYRVRKIFHSAQVKNRNDFSRIFQNCFTTLNHFGEENSTNI